MRMYKGNRAMTDASTFSTLESAQPIQFISNRLISYFYRQAGSLDLRVFMLTIVFLGVLLNP